ncbi:MAG: hypothetical protein N2554_04430 [Fimbriimonadales bacterium]|nr:hypothetical protein [Fimbriimonadales bacterium]
MKPTICARLNSILHLSDVAEAHEQGLEVLVFGEVVLVGVAGFDEAVAGLAGFVRAAKRPAIDGFLEQVALVHGGFRVDIIPVGGVCEV